MSFFIRQNATHKVVLGPVVAVGDGFTPVTTLALGTADEAEAILHDNGTVVDISAYTFAAITTADGYYHLTLQTGISGTVGHLTIVINDDSLCLPVKGEFFVLEEATYDFLFASGATPIADINAEVDTGISDAALATAANLATVDTVVDAIKVVTDNLPDSGALTTLQADTDDIQTRLPAALVSGKMDSSVSNLATAVLPTLGVLVSTTIATLATQTSFTLTGGSADNDAYNESIIIVTDSVTAAQKAVGIVSDYVGLTKTITLLSDPGIFTMAVGDLVDILAIPLRIPDILTDTNEIQGKLPTNNIMGSSVLTDKDDEIDAIKAVTDLLPDAGALSSLATAANQTTILNRIGSFTGTGVNTILGFFLALFKSDASNPSDVGGTYDAGTDSLEAIRNTAPLGTAMRGTDSAALASVVTEARLSELDDAAGKLVAIADLIKTETDKIAAGDAGAGVTGSVIEEIENIIALLPTALSTGGFIKADIQAINDDANLLARFADSVGLIQKYTVDAGTFTPTTTQVQVDAVLPGTLEATNDHFIGATLIGLSGANKFERTDITDYDGTNKRFTFTAMTAAFADNDTFIIV